MHTFKFVYVVFQRVYTRAVRHARSAIGCAFPLIIIMVYYVLFLAAAATPVLLLIANLSLSVLHYSPCPFWTPSSVCARVGDTTNNTKQHQQHGVGHSRCGVVRQRCERGSRVCNAP